MISVPVFASVIRFVRVGVSGGQVFQGPSPDGRRISGDEQYAVVSAQFTGSVYGSIVSGDEIPVV